MKQREIRDKENTNWTCVQAFAGTAGEAAKTAVDMTTENGMVRVVCTPSGGEQTVRLKLSSDWGTKLSDSEILSAIAEEKNRTND